MGAFLKLALIGDPVAHSRSPALHRSFLKEVGLAGSYEAIRVPSGEGARVIARLRAEGYRGANVTTPLKEEAYTASDRLDPFARAARSVNTLVFSECEVVGANTDGIGALAALDAAVGRPASRVLLLGAGPTARAAATALAGAGRAVFVWNRTSERADALVADTVTRRWTLGEDVDVVLSTLAPDPDLPAEIRRALLAAPVVVDANYGPRATLGALLGREVRDGLAMLRASARASFELFYGARPG